MQKSVNCSRVPGKIDKGRSNTIPAGAGPHTHGTYTLSGDTKEPMFGISEHIFNYVANPDSRW